MYVVYCNSDNIADACLLYILLLLSALAKCYVTSLSLYDYYLK